MKKDDEKEGQGLDRIFKYLTETPPKKMSELTRLFRRQVLPLAWMQTTEDGVGLLDKEIVELEDWYIAKYGKEGNKYKDWAKQILDERNKEGRNDPAALMKSYRLYLYQHLRSVDGGQLIRMTALAETEMAGPEEEEPEMHESPG